MIQPAETSTAIAQARQPSRLLTVVRANRTLILSAGLWILLVLNFNALVLPGSDAQVQFNFVKRIFGDGSRASGYFFGLALVETPFYGIGKLLDSSGLHTVSGHSVEETSVALGLGLLTVAAWPLLAAVIRGLSVGHAGFAILAAALGTPFFYYATFVPGKSHTLDTLLFTAAIYLVYRYFREDVPERWVPLALGALYALAYTTRYFNGAEAVALVLALVCWRRFRDAAVIAVTSAVLCYVLFLIPRALTVHVFAGGPRGRFKAGNVITFAPLNPLRMLFTDHRGYLVWSPVAVLAVIGLVSLFRRRPEHRRFLATISAMAVAMMAAYSLVSFWDGGWSFGQRFYTPLFPLVAIGLAGLLDVAPRAAGIAAVAAVAWSLFLCFNFATIGGPQYLEATPGGVEDLALVPLRTHTSAGAYAYGLWYRSNLVRPLFAWPFGR